jgi:hypothetical protein
MLLTAHLTAQSNYEKGMENAFGLWSSGNNTEASNLFERIAKAETDNWLPRYYAAQVNVMDSFNEKDKEVLTAKLHKAQDLLNDAKTISQNNPEIMVMQALLHTAWVAYDGATYGMQLSGTIVSLYTKARALAPENPRVAYCKAEWDIGGAKFFGQDTKPFCKDLEYSLELFANFKPKTGFHPKWGKERVEQLVKECQQ